MNIVNRLPMQGVARAETDCCPLINPADWDEQTYEFDDKMFVRVRTMNFLHMPLNMGRMMRRVMRAIEKNNAGVDPAEFVILADESSPWYSNHYIAVSDEVPGFKNTTLSGKFLTKVFDGPYKNAGQWYEKLLDFTFSRGYEPMRTFFYYTVCPRCAKKYGKNYVIGFEQVE